MSHNVICFGYFMPTSHGVNKKAPPIVFPHPPRFSSGLLDVLQEILDQPSFAVIWLFAKDNAFSKKIRVFILRNCWSVLILLYCFVYNFFTIFFTALSLWNHELKAVAVFPVSEGTKFEDETNSIILGY